MLSRKKRSLLHRRIRKIIYTTLSLLLILLIFFEFAVKSQMTSMLIEEMKRLTETAVIDAVDCFLNENPDVCDGLIEIHYAEGSVQAISTNSAFVNRVKTTISKLAQKNIDAYSRENGVSIPLGGLTGLVFLADTGPRIRLRIDSKQTVKCSFESTFESAGVNQTLHHIVLNTDTEVTIYSPYRISHVVDSHSSFEIAQTVIVGTVPSYTGVVSY